MRMSVGIKGRAPASLHGGLNATAARNFKLLGRTNSLNKSLLSDTKRAVQPPFEKPTMATRCGSTKVCPAKKARAPRASEMRAMAKIPLKQS
jgi:hypothetical protein